MKGIFSFLTRVWFTIKMAAHGILSNTLRSFLTILGVAIGVASVVSLMGIGEGARQSVVKQFESLGSNVIEMKAQHPSVEFEPELAEELVERVQGLEMATPVFHTNATMKWRRARGNVDIIGVNSDFHKIRDNALLSGNFFTELHVKQRSPVAVLGYNMGVGLMKGRNPVGQTFTLDGQTYRIVGVLEQKGAGNAEGIDDKIIIPYTSALKIADKRKVDQIWGKAASKEEADLVVVQLGRIFKRKLGLDQTAPTGASQGGEEGGGGGFDYYYDPYSYYDEGPSQPQIPSSGEDLITITSLNQLVEEADNANRVMTLLLGGIAAVSLLVGGLGIMNIMLVAVTERTEEIGLRRAIGAKQSDLLLQFILEALFLSAIGAIAGTALGVWGLSIFEKYGFSTAVNFQAIEIATIVALCSGLLFGVYPAISASALPPVEALKRQ